MADRIITKDGVCGGRPIIRGTRITVLDIVNYMEIYGDRDRILQALPHLGIKDIDAALNYYREHTEEIEGYRKEEEKFEIFDAQTHGAQ